MSESSVLKASFTINPDTVTGSELVRAVLDLRGIAFGQERYGPFVLLYRDDLKVVMDRPHIISPCKTPEEEQSPTLTVRGRLLTFDQINDAVQVNNPNGDWVLALAEYTTFCNDPTMEALKVSK